MSEKNNYNVTEDREEWDRLRAKYSGIRLERPPGDGWFSLNEMLRGSQDDAREAGTKTITRSGLQSRIKAAIATGQLEKYPEQIDNQSWYRETEAERKKERKAALID